MGLQGATTLWSHVTMVPLIGATTLIGQPWGHHSADKKNFGNIVVLGGVLGIEGVFLLK